MKHPLYFYQHPNAGEYRIRDDDHALIAIVTIEDQAREICAAVNVLGALVPLVGQAIEALESPFKLANPGLAEQLQSALNAYSILHLTSAAPNDEHPA